MDQEIVLPVHLGIILDGNRRWAASRGQNALTGHNEGYKNFKTITKYAFDRGVTYVSAYVFSQDNWQRTKDEVKYLMGMAMRVLTKDLAELNKENIKVIWIGSTDRLSQKLLKAIKNAEEKTKNNTHGTLCLCFNYGGHQEIVDAIKKLIATNTPVEEIDEEKVRQSLYAPNIPSVDLVIRTSGEKRLSGFMLHRSAYSELYFSKKYWPEFTKTDLDKALEDYSTRTRRFGK